MSDLEVQTTNPGNGTTPPARRRPRHTETPFEPDRSSLAKPGWITVRAATRAEAVEAFREEELPQ